MADLEKLNFSSLHPLFAVEPRRRRAMPDYIRGQLSQQTPRTVHRVSSAGWNRAGDTFFYAAGGQLVFAKEARIRSHAFGSVPMSKSSMRLCVSPSKKKMLHASTSCSCKASRTSRKSSACARSSAFCGSFLMTPERFRNSGSGSWENPGTERPVSHSN